MNNVVFGQKQRQMNINLIRNWIYSISRFCCPFWIPICKRRYSYKCYRRIFCYL